MYITNYYTQKKSKHRLNARSFRPTNNIISKNRYLVDQRDNQRDLHQVVSFSYVPPPHPIANISNHLRLDTLPFDGASSTSLMPNDTSKCLCLQVENTTQTRGDGAHYAAVSQAQVVKLVLKVMRQSRALREEKDNMHHPHPHQMQSAIKRIPHQWP